ncbi:MAG: hypothetical protein WEF28_13925 [Acidimicrobiia bacterium]
MRSPAIWLMAIVGMIFATSACGGAEAETTVSVESGTKATPDTDGGCPLNAEQVSEVLGAELVAAARSCSFFPLDGALPNASHNPQSSIALLEETRAEYGYHESVASVGKEAYVARLADGTWHPSTLR